MRLFHRRRIGRAPRVTRLLDGIDVRDAVGLEIGPLDRPIVSRRNGVQVFYLDINSTEELRARFAGDGGVSEADICEIDYPTHGRPLGEVVDRRFDYILASHVFEHIPDPIRWLQELSTVLNPGGVVAMAIPDRRFTFDAIRPPTSIGEILDAYYSGKRRPSFADVFDQNYYWRTVQPAALWKRKTSAIELPATNTLEVALGGARTLSDPDLYIDVHCNIVSDREFREFWEVVGRLGLSNLSLKRFFPTEYGENEFIVHLQAPPRSKARD